MISALVLSALLGQCANGSCAAPSSFGLFSRFRTQSQAAPLNFQSAVVAYQAQVPAPAAAWYVDSANPSRYIYGAIGSDGYVRVEQEAPRYLPVAAPAPARITRIMPTHKVETDADREIADELAEMDLSRVGPPPVAPPPLRSGAACPCTCPDCVCPRKAKP